MLVDFLLYLVLIWFGGLGFIGHNAEGITYQFDGIDFIYRVFYQTGRLYTNQTK